MNPGKAGIHNFHCVISVKREWVAKRREEFDSQRVLDQCNSSYHTQPYPITCIEKYEKISNLDFFSLTILGLQHISVYYVSF